MIRSFKTQYLAGAVGLFFILISILADTLWHTFLYNSYSESQVNQVQRSLLAKQVEADSMLHKYASVSPDLISDFYEKFYETSKHNHIQFYITRLDGTILFYTTNEVFPSHILLSGKDSELQKLPNGYYLQKNILNNNLVYISLIPVQYQYAIENQYLQNFIPFLQNNNDFILSKNRGEGFQVHNLSGQFLFSLTPKNIVEPFNWIAFLFLAGCLVLVYTVYKLKRYGRNKKYPLSQIVTYLILNGIFILFWKVIRLPEDLYRWPVFSSHYYGSSSFFPSLGDLLLFSLLLFYFFYFTSGLRINYGKKRVLYLPIFFLLVCFTFMLSSQIVNLISSLVMDSIIPFDLGNIFSINFYSVVGIGIVFIFIGCYFILIDSFSKKSKKYFTNSQYFWLLVGFSMLISATILSQTPISFYIAFIFNVIVLAIFYYKDQIFRNNKIVFSISVMAISSLFISIILSKYNEQKQADEQHTIAVNTITERDPVAEFLFTNIYNQLLDNEYIKKFFKSPLISEQELQSRIQQLYQSGYFSKYDIDISTFASDGQPFKNPLEKSLSYYTAILEREGAQELPNNLYFLHRHSGLPTYLSKIQIVSNHQIIGMLLIQMQQKPFYEESVYPELLVSETLKKGTETNKYSFAVYSNGLLLNQRGEYPYPGFQNFKVNLDSNNSAAFKYGSYTHLVHQPHPNLLVIVSTKTQGFLYYVSSFAFVFLFMALSFILFGSLPYLLRIFRVLLVRRRFRFKNIFNFNRLSFRNKILMTVISGMTISMLLIGFVTVSYINYQYNKDELDKLRKKTRLISTRLSNDLQDNERKLAMVGADIRTVVKTLSDMYQADINVFDIKGNLISSTESAIYDKLIIAPKMEAGANIQFSTKLVSQVIQEEKIGKLRFTSCYMPIRNSEGQVVGYLNVPYFSKESELKSRLSSFLEALVNLYLLLFLILVILGIFITRALTAPLEIIRNYLMNTSLSGKNEFIDWNTHDEIGKLVKEYNSMILALKESAERLAQSEREDALKELAQHVAHEIKNPLTPMKLGIQQLQNAYNNHDENYDTLFKKVTAMIVRQIDTLSAIATDFNASAKQGNPEIININNLLLQVCELFGHNKSIKIKLDLDENKSIQVKADLNKITRVLTNLVNNGIQSIPESRSGIIYISSRLVKTNVIIAVEDNGTGIPESLRKKIFIPNFSTKSSGTGLGLAISKAIVEQAGGTISFTSIPDKGSVFTIILPCVAPEISSNQTE